MAEKEYIEREKLYKDVSSLEVVAYKSDNEDFDNGVKFLLEKLDTIPAAAVVEVVRCKDCVHYQNGACNHFGYYTYAPDVDEDDFCSYGERKERE